MLTLPSYVVVTAARNEEMFIEYAIRSVLAQTVLPLKWTIVSDGSTDQTDTIVQSYAIKYPWIELARMPERRQRHFAGKALAFNAGCERVKDLPYEMIASLDADISFDRDYFCFLLDKLKIDPTLGVIGTAFREESGECYDYRFVNIEHVSGACQMFRRKCLEEIGGYKPVPGGGVDYIAVTTARMRGWKTRTFTEKTYLHRRPMGTALSRQLTVKFKFGIRDYTFGNHPVWEAFRIAYQLSKTPVVIGGCFLFLGYIWALFRREPRPVSREFVAFERREQMARLKQFFKRKRTVRIEAESRSANCA